MVFTASLKVTTKMDNMPEIKKALEQLAKKDVYVGIPEGDVGNHPNITNPQLLYVLTHGVRKKEMREEMNDFMGITAGGMPIMRDFNTFTGNMDKGMQYSAAYDLFLHEHGSPLWQIPPRPVLEPAINHSKDLIAKQLRQAVLAALNGQDPTPQLREAGQIGANAAHEWFYNPLNNWPPNSPVTIHGSKPDKNGNKFIKGKGSDHPMIDTGALRRAITYVIAEK